MEITLSEIRWGNTVTNDMKIKAYVGYFSGTQPLESLAFYSVLPLAISTAPHPGPLFGWCESKTSPRIRTPPHSVPRGIVRSS